MNLPNIIQLCAVAAIPAVFSAVFYLLKKKTAFGKSPRHLRQILIGVLFGGIACLATELGVPYADGSLSAIINVRDAAPICAGLFFGAPAGIIAGLLGGIGRAVAALWGAGVYSWVACSVSTALAGILAALARQKMFNDRCPSALFSAITAVVTEVIHMVVLILTHMEDAAGALQVVKLSALPMIICNAASVFAAGAILALLRHESHREKKEEPFILETVETLLLIAIAVAFCITNSLVYVLQTNTAKTNVRELLTINVDDIREDILDSENAELIQTAKNIALLCRDDAPVSLDALAVEYGVSEINIVSSDGIITDSTEREYIGFDMKNSPQSAAFMILTQGVSEYAQDFGNVAIDEQDEAKARKYVGIVFKDGFLQIGLDYSLYSAEIAAQIRSAGRNRHIGETGFAFICLPNGHTVGGASDLPAGDLALLMDSLRQSGEHVMGEIRLSGGKMYYLYTALEGYDIVGVISAAEAMETRDTMLYLNSFMEVLVFAALFVLIFRIVSKKVVNKIRDVNVRLSRISEGNLDEKVEVGGSQEMVSLSADINTTVSALRHYIEETSRKIDDELHYAQKIQHSALPNVFPAFPEIREFDIFASMDTAKDVGGDFYDFYMLDDSHLAFLIADVSGKGIPAAMFMMTAKTLIRSLAETGASVEEVFRVANEKLCENNEAGMFVTAWMAVLDIRSGELRFANAGHNPPLLARGDGGYAYLRTRPGLVLAGMEGIRYRAEKTVLQPGDRLFLYTDGVTEATSAGVQLYGEQRLLSFLNENSGLSPEQTVQAVRHSIDEFVGEAEQFDDITMLMIKFEGNGMDTEEYVYRAQIGEMETANAALEAMLTRHNASPKATMQLMVAFEEMFVNVCHYAYPDRGEPGEIRVRLSVGNGMAEITLTDSGVPFNPLGRKDPDITLAAEDRQIGGLGIYMVRKTMDEVLYRYENEQNILTMKKKI